jgi:CRISPR-associated endonuclease/helicase Cas3
MLADWLGSDTAFFPMACGEEPDRMSDARHRACEALGRTGLAAETTRLRLNTTPPSFANAFAVPEPRPMQKAAVMPEASCVVLESETGSGKTEAALWRFLHLFEAGAVDGLYFALPTRVAATQMFVRVRQLRDRVFGLDGPVVVLAVPGQQMADTARGHPLPGFGFAWDDDPGDAARQSRWAAEHPKRFLAAQIAVGTVDQALLGAIQVRHAHLRGTSLLRHLLVVDEVHASDRYMERLLVGLLREHTQAGGHALLLSATLGAGMRSRLLDTDLPSPETAEAMAYPALSWAQDGCERTLPLAGSGSGKAVSMALLDAIEAPERIAAEAVAAAMCGAKVLVIRNTVGAAVATAAAMEAALAERTDLLFKVDGIATVHHGRFGPEDRRLLDTAVECSLGKERPEGGMVVVGTQTLEVSLDLDADLLITDLCPVDVLLQRIGRLHRHERNRPRGFEVARAVVLTPRARDLLPLGHVGRNGLGGQIYDDLRVIEATWRLMEAHETWLIPTMNRLLVERATHPMPLAAIRAELVARDDAWQGCLDKVEGTRHGQVQQAGYALLDRELPFDKLIFDQNDHLATRLGAADRLILFDPPVLGPFGQKTTMLRIPAHLLDANAPEADPTDIAESLGTVTFGLGQRRFRYDRFGLRLT